MATKGTVPQHSRDANAAPMQPTKYKHATTVGRPMHDQIQAEPLEKDYPQLPRDSNSRPAAWTQDPRTEVQSVPTPATNGPDSRDGKPDVVSAERGSGRRAS